MAVYDQFPSSCNTVARSTDFACRYYHRMYKHVKIDTADDKGINLLFPLVQMDGDSNDAYGNVWDKFVIMIPKTSDSVSGGNKPWTYVTNPDSTVSSTISGETWLVSSSPQSTFAIPNTVDTPAKACDFWCRLYRQMFSYRKICLLDTAGERPFSIATQNSEAQDNNGKNYDLFYIYIPKDVSVLAGGANQWTYATSPATVDVPPGYFN
ncbi:hypothetical protein [Gloeothece verrucosa]|uniref:Uncharacterized protein n=1 Tax=Gloeothece verrucosa (strain PCC 7822) TaxID=497965 RepID=E0U8P4_GLOV7|nr:hypothetical protein [Gloeothece verrucosa]ADN14575.1 hypothetical protein Cyan7822_2604 [Gloeothece verrucosa PCC 7822]ADN14908.1 hypothetical protein Cyan7822_2951 [Gloeothece verrucosa PCC 7822]ADN15224.1 hypothetical protein Cyan7822_3274 [Gloeothece verrucosa PCC 7822]ADN16428.1 hypothetical protein Cyan7822_4518 [Gloeothece verrucosa PCC 7822]